MAKPQRVTVRDCESSTDAQAAERLLIEHGLPEDAVSRWGKKVRVALGGRTKRGHC